MLLLLSSSPKLNDQEPIEKMKKIQQILLNSLIYSKYSRYFKLDRYANDFLTSILFDPIVGVDFIMLTILLICLAKYSLWSLYQWKGFWTWIHSIVVLDKTEKMWWLHHQNVATFRGNEEEKAKKTKRMCEPWFGQHLHKISFTFNLNDYEPNKRMDNNNREGL